LYRQEVIELVRKLVLTAVTVQIPKGSMVQVTVLPPISLWSHIPWVQVVVASGIIILHVIALAHYKPFKRFKHTLLALFTYAMMLFVFLGGLTLKVKVKVSKEDEFGRGISGSAVGACLVFALVSVVCLGLAMAADDMQRAARAPVMRFARKSKSGAHKPVTFPLYSDASGGRFHLFLSHVWSTGQDQVLSIKKELTLLVPSIRVFLDIEK
jgi:hypothetical protein